MGGGEREGKIAVSCWERREIEIGSVIMVVVVEKKGRGCWGMVCFRLVLLFSLSFSLFSFWFGEK